MTDLGIDLTKEDLDVMMDEADINRDGRIDYAGQTNSPVAWAVEAHNL